MTTAEAPILLVEDNPAHVELALHAFSKHDMQVQVARDGEEALETIFGAGWDELPSLILLDLNLPRVDGLEVLRRVKGDWRTRTIPVVVLTSSQDDSDRVESYNLGANNYIVKPVDFDKFIEATRVLSLFWRASAETA